MALPRTRFPSALRLLRVQPRRRASSPAEALVEAYAARIRHYTACELKDFRTEGELSAWLERPERKSRTPLLLCDSRGRQWTSEEFAAHLERWFERSPPELALAIGPADGWSPAMLERADLTVAFGRMTLPHELAAVVLAEQTYRALTILSGHPYHTGH